MRIEKLEFVKNIDKFENNSDEYVDINLNRKVTELSSVSYEKKLYSFYLLIGEDGRINSLEILNILKIAKFTHKIEVPENIIEGEIYFKREEYNEDGIKVKELDFLEIDISKNIIGCYFTDNRLNIYFGVKICENIVILINRNNYAEGILIYGKFEIENDRFYWKK